MVHSGSRFAAAYMSKWRTGSRRFPAGHMLRLFSSTSTDQGVVRRSVLHEQLETLGVDASGIFEAALRSVQDPTGGYDNRFGKPAIKTYRAFLENKKGSSDLSDVATIAAAGRCARQIDFLMKRHKSHEAEWVRHTDEAVARRQTFPLMLLLDNVRSAFNVGSLFRTADACGCCEVITTGITPHPGGSGQDKLAKSALGADRIVPNRHFITTREAVEALRREKPSWSLVGLETTERSILYTDLKYHVDEENAGTILILGNEVTGVDTEIMPLLDHVVEIPMFGAKNSLNVASCGPVVLYEILRQWNKATPP